MKAGKVWGQTELIHANGVLEFHRIEYKAGFKCSEHAHEYKWNGFFVESGKMIVRVWQDDQGLVDETILEAGDFTQVKPGKIHQFEGLEDGVAFELYWAEFNHDDIVRRTKKKEIIMFKNIDKMMMMKLALLHVVVITISNALVSIPVEIAGIKLTWAAFTFPLVVLATDLTVRMLGKGIARATIAAAYPFAIIGSICVVLAEGAPESVAMRIGFASATAYAVGTFLDVYVFQYFREQWSKQWWIAPALSTIVANIIDTYTFFAVAFNNSADEYMAANWVEIAGSQVVIKIAVGLIVFLPAYGVLLRYLKTRLADTEQG